MSKETGEVIGVTEEHRTHIIEPHKQFTVGTFIIRPFDTEHDCPGSMGFLLQSSVMDEKLVFITDSFYSKYRFRKLSYIMIECNYAADILQTNVVNGSLPEAQRARLVQSHFSLEHVKEFLKANDMSQVREIYLMHLSAGNSDAVRFKREIQAATGTRVIVCEE
jgi:phosphoribosyl 1,2-cyclic phosphodiesterase